MDATAHPSFPTTGGREHVCCPACDSQDVHTIESWPIRSKKRRVVGCHACGLLFVHPQPTAEALAAHYAPEGAYRSAHAGRPPATTKPGAPALIAALDAHFPALRPAAGARVLDFGCGAGAWLNAFQDHGWETFGIEPSTDLAFSRHQRLPAVPADERFDFVMIHHVLEHLGRPLDTLREIVRAIKPGGCCLVSVPRLDTVGVHRDVEYCLQARTHIVAYTEACLTHLLALTGVGVVEALHGLDEAMTHGRPTSLRLLGRKGASPRQVEDPLAALQRLLTVLPDLAADKR